MKHIILIPPHNAADLDFASTSEKTPQSDL